MVQASSPWPACLRVTRGGEGNTGSTRSNEFLRGEYWPWLLDAVVGTDRSVEISLVLLREKYTNLKTHRWLMLDVALTAQESSLAR